MQISEQDFERLANYMYTNYGINLKAKKTLIEGRLSVTIQKKGFQSFSQYVDYVLSDTSGGEVSTLVSKLTTNYTYFLREERHYEFMTKVALPKLCPQCKDKDLRIWSAGCSSGEEPYSIAMTLDHYFGMQRSLWDKVVLASDISDNVLRTAKSGVYSKERLSSLPPKMVKQYFTKMDGGNAQVTPYLRQQVAFRKINLMDPFQFKRLFHIVFCRNVMIYFDTATRKQLVEKFYDVLLPGGYLFIGLSETAANLNTRFHYIEPAIYQK